ncbi:MAG: transglutaminase domain-containing protein [Lachnospiraceae bacterium]|nr:transglutaminase domain-containing protein [Lachnospiraceae bacterium]
MARILRNKQKRKTKKQPQILLSEGIILSGDFCEQREKRWTDYFVRVLSLFAIVTGSLGGMLSAFDITYEKWIFFMAALIASLYCASLYFAAWWENIGYVLAFLFVLNAGLGLRTYISSGFYGILNDISVAAAGFFGSNAQVSYAEQIANHSLAISVAMCYFALIGCIFTNGLISRKMHCLPVTVFSVLFLLVPIYLEQEPSGGYVILLSVGILTVYILGHNHYSCRSKKEKACQKAAKKHVFSGSYSGRAAMGALFAVALLCTVVIEIAGLLIPKNSFMTADKRSNFKLQTMDTMENLYLLGMMGLINFYSTTGGLVNGRLGGVNSVRLDYETDLTLEFVPYTYDRIYLKTFVGAEYLPYQNQWGRTTLDQGWSVETAYLLQMAYLSGEDGYARGIMTVKNVAAMAGTYLPYYSQDIVEISPGMQHDYVFFPLLTSQPDNNDRIPADSLWLEIPEQNREVIADFCNEAGLSGSRDEIIDKLRNYFQDNFPYTLSPGITPLSKDFVNYFLTEKRKGYCAHYASAATLILRYMGIPARYVEGYAVDAIEIAEDGRLTEKNVSDYYDGASLLSQSSVISYDATDGNAHAWVEVYDQNLGWYPVEFTPYRTEEDENQGSIWEMFLRLFQTNPNVTGFDNAIGAAQNNIDIAAAFRISGFGFAISLGILIMAVPVGLLIRKCIWLCRYCHADRSEKLLMHYRNRIRKIYIKNRRNRELREEFAKTKNFEEQVFWLAECGFFPLGEETKTEILIQTLNEAAYSLKEISGEAFNAAMDMIHSEDGKYHFL